MKRREHPWYPQREEFEEDVVKERVRPWYLGYEGSDEEIVKEGNIY